MMVVALFGIVGLPVGGRVSNGWLVVTIVGIDDEVGIQLGD